MTDRQLAKRCIEKSIENTMDLKQCLEFLEEVYPSKKGTTDQTLLRAAICVMEITLKKYLSELLSDDHSYAKEKGVE